ncbi:MAG: hypothetical protein KF705_03215 [Phycisphaeraceae bacterium]|nr:hypothetical protein [Phycisphaeraceae bacterium]
MSVPLRVISPAKNPDALGDWRTFRSRGARCSWSEDGALVLAHRASTLEHEPDEIEPCEVGVLDVESGVFTCFGMTTAWSHADGARLQWIGAERAIFNTRDDDDRLHAQIVSLGRGGRLLRTEAIGHAVHTVSPDGAFALAIPFERLGDLRHALAIPALVDPHVANPAPRHSGVHVVDLARGTSELLLSLAEIAEFRRSALCEGRVHVVDDVSYAPGGRRVAVLHSFERADGIVHTRLLTTDARGAGGLRLVCEGRITRHAWMDDATLLVQTGAGAIEIVRDDEEAGAMAGGVLSLTPLHPEGSFDAAVYEGGDRVIAMQCRRIADDSAALGLWVERGGGAREMVVDLGRLSAHAPEPGAIDPGAIDERDTKPALDPFGTRVCVDARVEGRDVIGVAEIAAHTGRARPEPTARTERSARGAEVESRETDLGLLEEARAAVWSAVMGWGVRRVGGNA